MVKQPNNPEHAYLTAETSVMRDQAVKVVLLWQGWNFPRHRIGTLHLNIKMWEKFLHPILTVGAAMSGVTYKAEKRNGKP